MAEEKKEKTGPTEKKLPSWTNFFLWAFLVVGLLVAIIFRSCGGETSKRSKDQTAVLQPVCKSQMLRLNKKGEQRETSFTAEAGEKYEIFSRHKDILLIRQSGTDQYRANTTHIYSVSGSGKIRLEALEDGTTDIMVVRVK